jgi:hypothetical protein
MKPGDAAGKPWSRTDAAQSCLGIKKPSRRRFSGLPIQGPYTAPKIEGEHELDAALSAWATRKGLTEDWPDIIGAGGDLVFPVDRYDIYGLRRFDEAGKPVVQSLIPTQSLQGPLLLACT